MIFLSYAREDQVAADAVVAQLAAEEIACCKDPVLAKSDPFWRERIRDCLSGCAAMLALESVWASASPWVDEERRAFKGPIFSLKLTPAGTGDRGYKSTHLTSPNWIEPLRRAATLPEANDVLALSCPEDDSDMLRRRATAIRDAGRWLQTFRDDVDSRSATRQTDGQSYINAIDYSRVRRIWPDSDIFLGLAPVTNAQYRAFLDANGIAEPPTWSREAYRDPAAPVTGVSWFEAKAYAFWAGGDLPIEREWECAARGAAHGFEYATATGEINSELAWFGQAFAEAAPRPPDDFPPNCAGFLGLTGNTWDWTETAWNGHRVIKGGGCTDAAHFCRIGARYRNSPVDRDCCVGFRIKLVRPELS